MFNSSVSGSVGIVLLHHFKATNEHAATIPNDRRRFHPRFRNNPTPQRSIRQSPSPHRHQHRRRDVLRPHRHQHRRRIHLLHRRALHRHLDPLHTSRPLPRHPGNRHPSHTPRPTGTSSRAAIQTRQCHHRRRPHARSPTLHESDLGAE